MRPRFTSAGSSSRPSRPDRRPSRLKIGAATAAVAAITGVAVGATASPAVAATGGAGSPARAAILASVRVGQRAQPALVPATSVPATSVPATSVLAAPALGAPGPLAAPPAGGPGPLAAPGGGTGHGGSPLAATALVPAGSHPLPAQPGQAHPAPAQPSASPAAGGPARPGTAGHGRPSPGGSQPGGSQSGPAQAAPRQRYQFYDSVTPSAIPAGQIVATYASGPFAVPRAQVAGRPRVLWIDTNGTDPAADVLDVEPGDATPSMAASWARARLHANPNSLACIYTMIAEWPATRAAIATLPAWMQSRVRWWIADPTGYQHIVPGSDATQWYWGRSYDISTAKTGL